MYDTMEKVTSIRNYANKIGKNIDIQVDGGINDDTIKVANNAGANIFVLGTAFFKSDKLLKIEELL